MPPELIQILIQLPIVAVFIWYSERKDKQFLEFLREQRTADRDILKELLEQFEDHDKRVTSAITKMEERTASTKRSSRPQT